MVSLNGKWCEVIGYIYTLRLSSQYGCKQLHLLCVKKFLMKSISAINSWQAKSDASNGA